MFGNNSLLTRITVGKLLGLLVGGIGFFLLPNYLPDAGYMIRFGLLFWYILMGTVVGLFGVVTYHPVLRMPMPWWFLGAAVGGWMNFIIALFMYDTLTIVVSNFFNGAITSPFWVIIEGILVGLVMAWVCKRLGGEGKAIVDM